MSDQLARYFAFMRTLNSPAANDLTKAIVRSDGLPELLAVTSSPALRLRIQKDIAHGKQSNQHAG